MSKGAEKQKRYRERKREDVFQLLGDQCAHCGITDRRVLQIDHVRGGGTQHHRQTHNTSFLTEVAGSWRSGERGKYQLLCANCNWIKRLEVDGR
jgi:hypothetical protein